MSLSVDMSDLDASVSALDPLGFTPLTARFVELNETADLNGLRQLAGHLIERVPVGDHSRAGAGAMIRDLGFVLASVERHGCDYRSVPEAESTLLRLGDLTDEVPRDSVYTYALRNPATAARTFTAEPAEALFITQVRRAGFALRPAVDHLFSTLTMPLSDPDLASRLSAVADSFRAFATALMTVKRNVTPEVFSHRLRPYFPPMTVGGTIFFGPGGAQMTPLLIDIGLLRPEPGDETADWFDTYLDENLRYLPAEYRRLTVAMLQQRPLLPRLLDAATAESGAFLRTPAVWEQLRRLVRQMLRFRLPHLQMARANMLIRPTGSLGSGGYTTTSLDRLADLTTDRHQQLTSALNGSRPHQSQRA